MPASILLFTNDLRLADNPALAAAAEDGPVVPLFVLDQRAHGAWGPGAAARAWRAQSLSALARALEERGAWLVVRCGDTAEQVSAVARETGASTLHTAAAVEPDRAVWQRGLAAELERRGMRVRLHPPNLLHEPGTLTTGEGRPYLVFTAFHRAFERHVALAPPLPSPQRVLVPAIRPASDPMPMQSTDAPPGMLQAFAPGERGGRDRMERFLRDAIASYDSRRDRPADAGTSQLSPHLAFGEISVRELACRASSIGASTPDAAPGAAAFLRQLVWREFAYHLLAAFPDSPTRPLKPAFEHFPWSYDGGVDAWREGRTGYPLVDAGMRELAATGWMHNRVRMVVASFLTKDLLVPWQDGARWFWERLADADLANNTLGWQWVAGCGADAQPFFRIFNPVGQSRRFDAAAYVRRWVPELARVPDRWIHAPWEAPEAELAAAGVRLGDTYPRPIVDHAAARARALDAYRTLRAGGDGARAMAPAERATTEMPRR